MSKITSLIYFSVKGASSKLESCKLRPFYLRSSQINNKEILVSYKLEKKLRISSTISFSMTRVFPSMLTKEEIRLLLLRVETNMWKKLEFSSLSLSYWSLDFWIHNFCSLTIKSNKAPLQTSLFVALSSLKELYSSSESRELIYRSTLFFRRKCCQMSPYFNPLRGLSDLLIFFHEGKNRPTINNQTTPLILNIF